MVPVQRETFGREIHESVNPAHYYILKEFEYVLISYLQLFVASVLQKLEQEFKLNYITRIKLFIELFVFSTVRAFD